MDEFQKRYNAARSVRKERIELEGREVYRYCFNGRESEWDDTRKTRGDQDPEEIFTDAASTVAEEFYGELFSTMTPENVPWVSYEAGNGVDEDLVEDADAQIKAFEETIAKSIRTSNYYYEGPAAFHDAVFGTVAMWIDRPSLSMPINCEAVPSSELYLRHGIRGVEDRFRRKHYYYADLPALFPNATFPRDLQNAINKSKGRATVVWGFWRDYSDPGNPVWVKQVRVDGKAIGLDETMGPDGSIELIVGRYNPVPGSPWGRGPARRMLPTLRVLDEVTRMNLEGMDRTLDPAFVYPHDGILDLSEGIENGLGYPAMPGSGEAIQPLSFGNLDYGFFSEERLVEVIRDGFYRDVVQRGKTPPSASQYMGEEQKTVRRLARPAAPLWFEFGVGLLKRFEYLESQPGGLLETLEAPLLQNGTVIARPISPLERAQAREEVLTAQGIMAIANEMMGPEATALLIDGTATFQNIKTTLKDRIVQVRSQEEIQQMMQMMQQQQQQAPVEQG